MDEYYYKDLLCPQVFMICSVLCTMCLSLSTFNKHNVLFGNERLKEEWNLALVNLLTALACDTVVDWSLAPRCSYVSILL